MTSSKNKEDKEKTREKKAVLAGARSSSTTVPMKLWRTADDRSMGAFNMSLLCYYRQVVCDGKLVVVIVVGYPRHVVT